MSGYTKKQDNRAADIQAANIILPCDVRTERAILGALILDASSIGGDLENILRPSTFSDALHSQIYARIEQMQQKGGQIDLQTVGAACKDLRTETGGDILPYLIELTQQVGSGAGAVGHARILRDLETRRQLVLLGTELVAKAGGDTSGDVDELLQTYAAKMDETRGAYANTSGIRTVREIVAETMRQVEDRCRKYETGERTAGIPSGLALVDETLGGFCAGGLYVLAAQPSVGKSSLAMFFARKAAEAGTPVCIFSLEMSAEELAGKWLIGCGGVDPAGFRTGRLDAAGWNSLERAGHRVAALPIMINDRSATTVSRIRAQIQAMRRRGKCDFAVIDYLQLIGTERTDRQMIREQEVAKQIRALKTLAMDLGMPILVLSQLSRKVEERTSQIPQLSDLRESGAIEQDADCVMFIDRPERRGKQTLDDYGYFDVSSEGRGILNIAKNRHGQTGAIVFGHNESLTTFADYEDSNTGRTDDAYFDSLTPQIANPF